MSPKHKPGKAERDSKILAKAESAARHAPEPSTPESEPTESHPPVAKPEPGQTPRHFDTAKDLAAAIAGQCDLVAVATALLGGGDGKEPKGASVKARMWETLVEYLYGKPVPAVVAEAPPLRVIWDIPCPARERVPLPIDPQEE